MGAVRWRVSVFEALFGRIRRRPPNVDDPVQAYCDFLHHRFVVSRSAGHDVGNDSAFEDWIENGQPGYDLAA